MPKNGLRLLRTSRFGRNSASKLSAEGRTNTTHNTPYLRPEMESSETHVNTASPSTNQSQEGNGENTGEKSKVLTLTFRSNGSLDMAATDIGMFELWIAAKYLEHKGNELYTAAMIQMMNAQRAAENKEITPVRSMPAHLHGRN